MWLIIVAFAIVLLGWLSMRRANELCKLSLSPEGARLISGRAPAAFLSDASEVARRAKIEQATVRIVVESGEPRIVAPVTLSEVVVQQLRNVAGQYRVVHFRTGRRVSSS